MVNHGYLAVDFFFVLSGFVLGYAYDNRWKTDSLTPGGFMLRRVIRLHPMVVLSVILGAAAYLLQGSVKWDGNPVSLHSVALALVFGLFLLPTFPGSPSDVRGNNEYFILLQPSQTLYHSDIRHYKQHTSRHAEAQI